MISRGRGRDILEADSDGGFGVPSQVEQNPSLDYFTSRQMAALLGVSLRTLVNLRRRQALPYIKMGRLIRYRRDAVESTLKSYSIGRNFDAGDPRCRGSVALGWRRPHNSRCRCCGGTSGTSLSRLASWL